MEKKVKIADIKVILEKIKNWCAYQERCQQEVRTKLYDFELKPQEIEEIISVLVSENFINEERFAKIYAGGKFRIKKWGRLKIKSALKQKKLTDYCIKKALNEINDEEYIRTLEKLIKSKSAILKESNKIKRNYKLFQYAATKGFEQDLIMDVLSKKE